MTLQDVLNILGENPGYPLIFFGGLPIVALVFGWISSGEAHLAPWKFGYSGLVFAACIPGIFAFILNVYLFLFQRRDIFQSDLFVQILPIFAMIATLLIIRRNVDFDQIPGFGKLSGLVFMLSVVIALMWFLDRTNIIIFVRMEFFQLLLVFAVGFSLAYVGWRRFLA